MNGSYRIGELTERWSSGPGPLGFRYVGTRQDGDQIDLTTDHDGRPVRLAARHDGWELRAGAAGEQITGLRGAEAFSSTASALTGTSPGYDIAVATMLALQPGQTCQLTLLEVTEPVAAVRLVQHAWARTPDPEPDVQRYEVADLRTAQRWQLHLSGRVLLSRAGRADAVLAELTL